jgi:UDP-N-acetylmuramate dehydrogenase
MLNTLPSVRGRYAFNDPLSKYVWFNVGGPADVIFKPADLDDLIYFLKHKPSEILVFPLGVGSNVLIRDGGVDGVVIRLGRGFTHCYIEGSTLIAGAGVLDRNVALTAADAGLAGLEFLASIPGTIGGALKMNAGCYDSEVKDVLKWAKAIDLSGNLRIYTVDELQYTYRHCGLEVPVIFVEACFQAKEIRPSNEIHDIINQFLARREVSQPVRAKTGGSTFKNPEGAKAWELIDKVGGRGLMVGDAQFSEKHCNFLINTNAASSEDIETLGEIIRQRVLDEFGVELQWEIMRIGNKAVR